MTLSLFITTIIIFIISLLFPIIILFVVSKKSSDKEGFITALKFISIIDVIIILLLLSVWISPIKNKEIKLDNKSNNKNLNENITLENSGFKEITADEYLKLLKSNKKSIVLIARPTCGYCVKFTPILKEAKDDLKLTIYYLNTDNMSESDMNKFTSSLSFLSEGSWGTPLVMVIQDNKLVDKNEGYVELNTIKSFFLNNGFGN